MVKQEREYLITYALTETSRQKNENIFSAVNGLIKSVAVTGLSVSNVTSVAERERSARLASSPGHTQLFNVAR